ncbi:MAG: hypothetical protein HYX92_08670 [Chloroflexi bacterium]|nr:hypothetical protein [Chloroflexota bacterium]
MPRWYYMVQTVCTDPAKEKEFNDWYDNVHIPDLLEAEGFLRATRYENDATVPAQSRYLAIYEVESDDIARTWKAYGEHVQKIRAAGRVVPICNVVSRALWRQMRPTQEKKGA